MDTKWKENQRPNVEKDNEDYGDVVIVVVVVAIQSTVLSWESSIVAYFYPEQEQRKRKLNGALATARRDHRLRGLEDDALGTSQMDVLKDLVPLARLTGGGEISLKACPIKIILVTRGTVSRRTKNKLCNYGLQSFEATFVISCLSAGCPQRSDARGVRLIGKYGKLSLKLAAMKKSLCHSMRSSYNT